MSVSFFFHHQRKKRKAFPTSHRREPENHSTSVIHCLFSFLFFCSSYTRRLLFSDAPLIYEPRSCFFLPKSQVSPFDTFSCLFFRLSSCRSHLVKVTRNLEQTDASESTSATAIMADQLNMNGLNINGDGPRSYIPPHMRGKVAANGGGPAPGPGPAPAGPGFSGPTPAGVAAGPTPADAANGGLNSSAWAAK